MDAQNTSDVAAPAFKLVTVWAAVGLTSWADVAAFMAAIYSFLLITEWLWKKVLRPLGEKHGLLKRKLRRRSDYERGSAGR